MSSGSAAPSFIKIGPGPDTLTSAQLGSPIFTTNDSLWIQSLSNQSVDILLSGPSNVSSIPIVSMSLQPETVVPLHVFSSLDPEGIWTLSVTLQNSTTYTILVPFEIPALNSSVISLTEYSIQNGQINLGFSDDPSNAYNLEACLTSSFGNDTIFLSEPSSIGGGQMSLYINTSSHNSTVSTQATPSQPFSFWFELYYFYGYSGSLPNETVSRDLIPSRSSTALFNSSGSRILTLTSETNLRPGRYLIRAFFDSGSSLVPTETRALLLSSGNWFWLQGCNPFSVSQSNFTRQVNLDQDPKTWPKLVYAMYEVGGVESYSILPLQINLARIDFYGEPGNVKLSYLTYSIANNSDAQASGVYSGTIYVIPKSFPILLTVTPMIGQESLTPQSIIISEPFSDSQAFIPIGELTVVVFNNSKPDTGSVVKVSSPQGASISSSIDSTGNASFYLPPGFYNITASKGSVSKIGNATVVHPNQTIVEFSFTTSALPTYFVDLLTVPLLLGLLLNLWVWVIHPRRTRYKMI
ncbi:MAG: hypothetical protein OK439_05150 [Thaumarchaeota archaeon]|nr:hypothetical protein [Nitrososphaerota archaeon]